MQFHFCISKNDFACDDITSIMRFIQWWRRSGDGGVGTEGGTNGDEEVEWTDLRSGEGRRRSGDAGVGSGDEAEVVRREGGMKEKWERRRRRDEGGVGRREG